MLQIDEDKLGVDPFNGFLFQKDIYTTNLLYIHQKYAKNDRLPYLNIYDRIDHKADLSPCLQIRKEENDLHRKSRKNITIHSTKRMRKLIFPLPKVKTPTLSSIDFYEKYKGDYKLCYMDDDLNITSKKMKKFIYSSKVPTGQTNQNDTFNSQSTMSFENPRNTTISLSSLINLKNSNKTLFNFNPKKSPMFINEKLKKVNIIKNNNSNYDLMFKTQIKV